MCVAVFLSFLFFRRKKNKKESRWPCRRIVLITQRGLCQQRFAISPQMGYVVVMTLDKYLKTSDISSRAFAKDAGVSIHAVSKWRQKTRIPRPDMIILIQTLTAGKVKPADWYK